MEELPLRRCGNHQQTAAFAAAVAGGEGEELLVILRHGTAGIGCLCKHRTDGLPIGFLVLSCGKGIPWIHVVGLDHGEHLVHRQAVCGLQFDLPMLRTKIGVGISPQPCKHRPILHVVAIDDQVITAEAAAAVQEWDAAYAVFPIKTAPQVFLRVFRRMHDGIVHRRIRDGQPADAIAVPCKQCR